MVDDHHSEADCLPLDFMRFQDMLLNTECQGSVWVPLAVTGKFLKPPVTADNLIKCGTNKVRMGQAVSYSFAGVTGFISDSFVGSKCQATLIGTRQPGIDNNWKSVSTKTDNFLLERTRQDLYCQHSIQGL